MRLKKLVRADIQLKLTLYFALLSAFALVFQFLLTMRTMSNVPTGTMGTATQAEMFVDAATQSLLLSLAIVVPLTTLVGVLTTFRIAGPLYRFTDFLRRVRDGERPADCTIRKGDELRDLCELINETTAPLRRSSGADGAASDDSGEQRAA